MEGDGSRGRARGACVDARGGERRAIDRCGRWRARGASMVGWTMREKMDGRIDGRISSRLDDGTGGGTRDGWVDGWMDGWMDGRERRD